MTRTKIKNNKEVTMNKKVTKVATLKLTRKAVETAVRAYLPAVPAKAQIKYTIGKTGSKDLGSYNEFVRALNLSWKADGQVNTLKLTRKEIETVVTEAGLVPENAHITYVIGKTGSKDLGSYNEFMRAMTVTVK
jgi:16S rRNA C967 or C1407 C5-methylase (RsmB/RsmF family)